MQFFAKFLSLSSTTVVQKKGVGHIYSKSKGRGFEKCFWEHRPQTPFLPHLYTYLQLCVTASKKVSPKALRKLLGTDLHA